MAGRIRLKRTQVIEYEADLECYPPGFTLEQMAEHDTKLDIVDEMFFGDILEETFTYEIIKDSEPT